MDAVPSDNTANKLNRFCVSKAFVKFSGIFVILNNHSNNNFHFLTWPILVGVTIL